VGGVHSSLDASGAPTGSPFVDVQSLRAGLAWDAGRLGFTERESFVLQDAVRAGYTRAGGSPSLVTASAAFGELTQVNNLASALAVTRDPAQQTKLRRQLEAGVRALQRGLDPAAFDLAGGQAGPTTLGHQILPRYVPPDAERTAVDRALDEAARDLGDAVRFEVWAPETNRMRVRVNGIEHDMQPVGDGYWRVDVPGVRPGMDYVYHVGADGTPLPDPRAQWLPAGVHGPARVYDHSEFPWTDENWAGKPLLVDPERNPTGSVVYELPIATFTDEGTFEAMIDRIPHLVELGVDFVELMPVAAFDGEYGWGYDGVAWYAPHQPYGGPDGLKRLVNALHEAGIGVLLDVVYSHLGPSGNYLARFGPYMRDDSSPWGARVNLDGPGAEGMRRHIVDNALMWLEHYHVDGLRLDAVQALHDSGPERGVPHLLVEMSAAVDALSERLGRPLSLTPESDWANPWLVTPREQGGAGMDAAWHDEVHHALHAVITGETNGYYAGYGSLGRLADALQNPYYRGQSGDRYVTYDQNHDHIGNRPAGDRITDPDDLAIMHALLLSMPFTPLLFMGEEFGATTPHPFFSSNRDPDVARAVTEGRREELGRYPFEWSPEQVASMPDPEARETFESAKLDWSELQQGRHRRVFEFTRDLIALRKATPDLRDPGLDQVRVQVHEDGRWLVMYRGDDHAVVVNLSDEPRTIPMGWTPGAVALASKPGVELAEDTVTVPPRSAAVLASERSVVDPGGAHLTVPASPGGAPDSAERRGRGASGGRVPGNALLPFEGNPAVLRGPVDLRGVTAPLERLARLAGSPGMAARWAAHFGRSTLGTGLAGVNMGPALARAVLAQYSVPILTNIPATADGIYGAEYGGEPLTLALLGDSTMVGYGVKKGAATPGVLLASRLSEMLARPVRVVSAARIGARARHLAAQAESILERAQPDLTLVFIGPNDLIHRTPLAEATEALGETTGRLVGEGSKVVVNTCADLGTVLPWAKGELGALFHRWSDEMAAAQAAVVQEAGGTATRVTDLVGADFATRPGLLFSADRFHPSAAGYAVAVDALLPKIAEVLNIPREVVAATRAAHQGEVPGTTDPERPVTAFRVPRSAFRGDGRESADRDAVLEQARRVIDELTGDVTLPGVAGGTARVDIDGVGADGRLEVTVTPAGGDPVVLRFDSGPLDEGVVATTLDPRGQPVVMLSHLAENDVVERAIVHEVAETLALREGRQNEQDMLLAGPVAAGELSAHDIGRLAEMSVLAESGNAAEMLALARHLGLLDGTPGADQRRVAVEELAPGLLAAMDTLAAVAASDEGGGRGGTDQGFGPAPGRDLATRAQVWADRVR
ncbi:MAG TPA: malto-oligosyltrehalose trehalohydrolase, partial [Cryptosporangiaceae bacterium]|nr:malto-oligosyltrehalose trehalohydrolase [Cryptosporangiaceae bacterium]